MRKFVRRPRARPPISLIILPMIDVIFLLLLFFVMVTSFEAGTRVKLSVPDPEDSRAGRPAVAEPVVINCEVADPDAARTSAAVYRINADQPEPLSLIAARLASAKAANPSLAVVVRADRRLSFRHVRAVIQVVADNGIEVLNVSALRAAGGGPS